MSRQIDPLNIQEEDIDYVNQRPWMKLDVSMAREAAGMDDIDWNGEGVDTEDVDEEDPDDDSDDEDDGGDEYDSMSFAELQGMLKARELSAGGSTQDLIDRLREDDAEDEG